MVPSFHFVLHLSIQHPELLLELLSFVKHLLEGCRLKLVQRIRVAPLDEGVGQRPAHAFRSESHGLVRPAILCASHEVLWPPLAVLKHRDRRPGPAQIERPYELLLPREREEQPVGNYEDILERLASLRLWKER